MSRSFCLTSPTSCSQCCSGLNALCLRPCNGLQGSRSCSDNVTLLGRLIVVATQFEQCQGGDTIPLPTTEETLPCVYQGGLAERLATADQSPWQHTETPPSAAEHQNCVQLPALPCMQLLGLSQAQVHCTTGECNSWARPPWLQAGGPCHSLFTSWAVPLAHVQHGRHAMASHTL